MSDGELTRRRFILRGLAAAGLAGLSLTGAYSTLVEPYAYELTETDIFLPNLPDAFENFRVALLSDIHHGHLFPLREVERVVRLTNDARPDLVALAGDYTTGRVRYIEPCAAALGRLRAPSGVFAVLGNHDHYTDGELTTRALVRHGINVLSNANTLLRRRGATDALQLAGLDDAGWGKADWTRALHGLDASLPSILLTHEPSAIDASEARGVSLILAGHTHGGQIRLPFVGAPARFLTDEFRRLAGLYEREGTQLYVTRGVGTVGLHARLGARPEIALIRIKKRLG